MSLGGGDQLARGAASAIFKLCPSISQAEWDERVGKKPLNISKPIEPQKNEPKRKTRKHASE